MFDHLPLHGILGTTNLLTAQDLFMQICSENVIDQVYTVITLFTALTDVSPAINNNLLIGNEANDRNMPVLEMNIHRHALVLRAVCESQHCLSSHTAFESNAFLCSHTFSLSTQMMLIKVRS